jgi:hypothetical protein
MAAFKLVRIMQGSGWPSGHVAVDKYFTYPDRPGGNETCLTLDSCKFEELSREIDLLIEELEKIRADAPAKFAEWSLQETTKKNSAR